MRLAILMAAGGLLIGLSGRLGMLMPVGIALICAVVAAAVAEWWMLSPGGRIEITRDCDEKLSLGARNLVRIRLRNPSHGRFLALVRDEYPEGLTTDGNEMTLEIAPRSERDCGYHVFPPRRGDFEFGDIYLRLGGPLGLVVRQKQYPMKRQVKVYPNLLDIRRYDIGLKRSRALQAGQRVTRMRGRGTDFESLREYTPDDEFRAVDWKASARRGKLITRQYQEEKSQNVVLALDCGRVMGPVVSDLTRLDHAINAAMMLAHVAASRGDKVGLLAFGDEIGTFAPPRAGKSQTLGLLRQAYNLKEASGDSDYARAFGFLSRRWTRRSLIVIFTDLVDPESSKPLITQIGSLARKHLCLCVAMADPALRAAVTGEIAEAADAFTAAAARQALQARRRAAAQLARTGAIVLDVEPEKFTPAVVDAYLNIKAQARL